MQGIWGDGSHPVWELYSSACKQGAQKCYESTSKYIQWTSEQKLVAVCQCILIHTDCSRRGNVCFIFSRLSPQVFVYVYNLQVYQMHSDVPTHNDVSALKIAVSDRTFSFPCLFLFEQKSKDAWSTYVPWRESVHPSQQMHLAASRGKKLREIGNFVTLFLGAS